jgi:glycosyltransferase involved in cell wall biosynthesis
MKLCVITCYNQPDYVRAVTLRAAAGRLADTDVIVIKNNRTGVLRYAEVFAKLVRTRLRDNPDAYLLTFRGYEMLLPVRLLSLGKPLIYDEFINPIEWVVKEQRQVKAKSDSGRLYAGIVSLASRVIVGVVGSKVFKYFYNKLVQSVDMVLTDTVSHADVSAELTGVSRDRFFAVPVGADEVVFTDGSERRTNDTYTVLYYGNMLPLHGLQYVIEAAGKMRDKDVKFVLVGGDEQVARDVDVAVEQGARIDYWPWVEFNKLPDLMRSADLCLAGPFGDTFQAQYVITGKAYQFLAMGRPTVIGTNLESGAFTDKVDALVVPQGSSDALVAAIEWAMNNQKKLKAIGAAGHKLYAERYSNEALTEYMRELLSRVLADQARLDAEGQK